MQTLMVKSGSRYRRATPSEIAAVAGIHALEALNRLRPTMDSPTQSVAHLSQIFAGRDYESFAVLFLDSGHRLVECLEMFRGTINSAQVHPREIAKECLWRGAAAVVLAHNHPSGFAAPSDADRHITRRVQQALALIDVRVLDHIIVADANVWFSMADHNLL
jgi:DNA repair protein RadC